MSLMVSSVAWSCAASNKLSNFYFHARSLVYILSGFYWLPLAMKTFFWGHHSFLPFESICLFLIEYILQDSVDEGIATQANLYLHLCFWCTTCPHLPVMWTSQWCIPFIVNNFLVFLSSFSISDFSHGRIPKLYIITAIDKLFMTIILFLELSWVFKIFFIRLKYSLFTFFFHNLIWHH